ncbi:related to transposase [Sporisorium reilianum f. sp. reilianum]|uniref:Related to transposase n=1 Tax=Sporisorium reilianum f. sp. reilianum TaxID=72559 RepID=A0A2N8UHF2_9BASI|nr:related to transposase [Sporisorium reilianum f. sp. reilianum]
MTGPSFSKCSTASRMASAAKRDAKEARVQQAISEHRNGTYSTIRQAATANHVPESTLHQQLCGRKPKKDAQTGMQMLPPDAESTLVDLIRCSACSRYPLTPVGIRDYANTITPGIPGTTQQVDVRRNWMQGFLLRHPSIRSCWSRCLENARLKAANEASIQTWFKCFAEIINEFSVSSTDIFNMDETCFMFGQGGSEGVVVPAGDPASRFRAQPGTRESATVIKCNVLSVVPVRL